MNHNMYTICSNWTIGLRVLFVRPSVDPRAFWKMWNPPKTIYTAAQTGHARFMGISDMKEKWVFAALYQANWKSESGFHPMIVLEALGVLGCFSFWLFNSICEGRQCTGLCNLSIVEVFFCEFPAWVVSSLQNVLCELGAAVCSLNILN